MICRATGRQLTPVEQVALRRLAAQARRMGGRLTEMTFNGTEIYVYPHADGIAWGVNDGATGFCVARGICGSND